jgi:PTS system mannose-specific IID component
MNRGSFRALLRLLAVQGAWSYERMTGIGMGYAAEPLLEDLQVSDPVRHAEAAVRSAGFFNSHPYLAGIALGALARAEYDHMPPAQLDRLRAALPSPLGALGDQLFWVGLVPSVMALILLSLAVGAGWWVLPAGLVGFNLIRIATGLWGLRTGLRSGAQVGAAIGDSWLPRWTPRVGRLASLLVGVALPVLAVAELAGGTAAARWTAAAAGLVVLGLSWRLGSRFSPLRISVLALLAATLLAGILP